MAGDESPEISDISVQKLAGLLKQHNIQSESQIQQSISVTIKLNDQNYSLWSRLMKVAIGGRGRLRHITGKPIPPQTDEPEFPKWEQDDLTVFSWIIQTIEPDLVVNFVEYPTAKDLWEGLAATYSSGGDGLQIYDLMTKASRQQQGQLPLEKYYSTLQGIWREIDRRQPNPMTCPADISVFNRLKQETRLFQFLAGIHDRYDAVKRDLLKEIPFPSVEAAYAAIRRELARATIMNPTGYSEDTTATQEIGGGFAARGRGRPPDPTAGRRESDRSFRSDLGGGVPNSSSRTKDRSQQVCTHCGKHQHTKEGCFELIGYPEWWENKKAGNTTANRNRGGKASAAVGSPEITSTGGNNGDRGMAAAGFAGLGGGSKRGGSDEEGEIDFRDFKSSPRLQMQDNMSVVCSAQDCSGTKNPRWLFDCGATDTMTYDPSDIIGSSKPTKHHIQTANGGYAPVQGQDPLNCLLL